MLKPLFSPGAAADDPLDLSSEVTPDRPRAAAPAGPSRAPRDALDPRLVERHLGQLFATDGVIGCALVDLDSGLLVAEQCRAGVELDAIGAAGAQLLRARQAAARDLALPQPDEMTVTVGAEQQILRTLPRRPGLLLLALVDRPRANLALTRFRMAEAQRNLA